MKEDMERNTTFWGAFGLAMMVMGTIVCIEPRMIGPSLITLGGLVAYGGFTMFRKSQLREAKENKTK